MTFAGRILSLLLLAVFFAVPAMATELRIPLRLLEDVAPGASLQQLSGSNPELAAALSAAQAEVSKDGQARVAVKTAVAFAPETLLGDWERTVQRREIASAAAALRKAMPKAKNFTARLDMPYVLLTVDQAGLAKLQTVPGLVKIVPEEAFNWRRDFVRLRSAVRTKAGTAPSSKAEARRISPRIVGGTDASPGVHPFQVGLMNKRVADNFQSQFCGGTLVSEYHVVTAAHCVDFIGVPRSQVQVLVGTQSLARRGGGNRINVSRIVIHPGWNPETSEYDAAVLELATPVTGIAFATLATMEPTTPGTLLRVTGWGWLSLSGDSPSNLQQVDVPFVPTVSGACGSQEDVTPRMICAGGEAGKDSCKGDSGGPLTINRGSGFTELVGIVSFGEDCALPGYPGVYTNVAETSINGFIRGIVDAPRAFQFEVSAYEVNEAARRVTVRVTRAFTAGTATVMVAAVPGTAAARSDFRAISRKMTFRPGVTSVSVPITIVNDRAAEGPETFTVSLSSPSGGLTLGSPTAATVTIIDND